MANSKRTRNPGWVPGGHWVHCEVCGDVVRVYDAKERWDGKLVCEDDWEPRHPLDLYRPPKYDGEGTPDGPVRVAPDPDYVEITYAEAKDTVPSGQFEDNNSEIT